ncbi:hypothetical protein PPACK8108_LOCUS26507 [Phakopsora pachyrhizi]|uniref:Uncharacterized protein n=1 Tax=Phakopsora pachyrhizi TaxID=170000 RepID=A0AAV0BBA9_PHAPC|nr:hypothetical protein PPACK8108_LOCUS17685 [Phakopsora pachyrhizi]CAH7690983.1 hypothetical protein PPACK8108_LOCUS26507 [Phakopsora pachyrhizi]
MGVDDKEEGEAEKKLIERATMGATQQWNLWNGLLKAYLIRGSKDAKEDSWGPNSVDNDDGFEDEMAMTTPEGQRRLRIGQCCCGCSLIELNYRHRWMEFWSGAGEASDLPMRGMDVADGGHGSVRTPHPEDGGDGGAAEDRARLCELFDWLWKPGGQG